MLMKSWQQQGLKREPMMQGKRPNTVVVLFLHAHKLALPESRSLSQRAPTWMIGQDSVCIWYIVVRPKRLLIVCCEYSQPHSGKVSKAASYLQPKGMGGL